MSEDFKDTNMENNNINNSHDDSIIADEAVDNKAPDADCIQQDSVLAGQDNSDANIDEGSLADSSLLDKSLVSNDGKSVADELDKSVVNDSNLDLHNSESKVPTEELNAGNDSEAVSNSPVSLQASDGAADTETNSAKEADAKAGAGADKKALIYKVLNILCIAGFIIFGALFINEVVIQPIRIKNSIDKTRELYKPVPSPIPQAKPTDMPANELDSSELTNPPTPTPDPNRDEFGRLLQFSELLAINEDVKGWITIPDSTIDYVVVQASRDNPEYYLDKDIFGEYSKAGTLFLDVRSSVERNTQSLVIHGHNMVSTPEKMFRDLIKYKVEKSGKNKNKVPNFYKEHPLVNFDTIYQTGQWKIFSVFITNGSTNKREAFFDFTKANFKNASDFLNFVYQLRIRSELNIDCVDITDSDQLLVLSTCSYEIDDYRTVVVARRLRDGEDPYVDVDSVTVNKNPLYPNSYYYRYGGKAPKLPETFEEALESGLINWYTPPELVEEKMKQDLALKEAKELEKAAAEAEKAAAEADKKSKKEANSSAKSEKLKKKTTGTTESGNQEAAPLVTPLPEVTDEAAETGNTNGTNSSNEADEPAEAGNADDSNDNNDNSNMNNNNDSDETAEDND